MGFWALLGATGYLISRDVPVLIQNIMKNVCAWTPTFIILLMFKRLYPGLRLRDYFVSNFLTKMNFRDLLVVLVLQFGILATAVLIFLNSKNLTLTAFPVISAAAILPAFIMSLTSGAMGEELGWRGYMLKSYQEKYSPLKSALLVGLVWAFWHLPLWIFSGYTGSGLIVYSIFFVIAILSLSVLITYFYNKSGNIIIAIWMHFLFNFLIQLITIDFLQLLILVSIGYLLLAIILVLTQKDELLRIPPTSHLNPKQDPQC